MEDLRTVFEIVENKSEMFSNGEYLTLMNSLKSIFRAVSSMEESKQNTIHEEEHFHWIDIELDVFSEEEEEDEDYADEDEDSYSEEDESISEETQLTLYACPVTKDLLVSFTSHEKNLFGKISKQEIKNFCPDEIRAYIKLAYSRLQFDSETDAVFCPQVLGISEWRVELE